MRTAKQLGAVIFGENYMHIDEEFAQGDILSEMIMSAGGTHIVFENEIGTPYITLDSQGDSWITEANKNALQAMWSDLNTASYTLTYDNSTTVTVRMAREKELSFTPLYEGGCDYYRAIIPLAKV